MMITNGKRKIPRSESEIHTPARNLHLERQKSRTDLMFKYFFNEKAENKALDDQKNPETMPPVETLSRNPVACCSVSLRSPSNDFLRLIRSGCSAYSSRSIEYPPRYQLLFG